MEETIQIWLVSVEVQHFKQNFSGIKNPSYFLWTEASPSTLRRFWTQHLFGEEIQVQTTIVKNFKPLHRSYLLEKSLMWAECRIWKALRKTFSTLINLNPFNALSDMVSIEFQRVSQRLWNFRFLQARFNYISSIPMTQSYLSPCSSVASFHHTHWIWKWRSKLLQPVRKWFGFDCKRR